MKKLLMIILSLIHLHLYAGENTAAFLKIPIDAKVTALGSAATALDGSAAGLFYNPAGLAFTSRQYNLFISSRYGMLGSSFNTIAFAYKLGFATLAVGWIHLGIDQIPKRDWQNNYLGNMNSSQDAYFIGISKALFGSYSIGVSLKYIRIGFDLLDEHPHGSGIGLDMGLIYRLSNEIKLGLFMQDNFEIKWNHQVSDQFPLTLKLGAVYLPKFLNSNLGFHADIVQRQSYPIKTNIGLQYVFPFKNVLEKLTLRMGISNVFFESRDLNLNISDLNSNDVSFGAGLGMQFLVADFHITFDYAFKSHAYLDNSHFTSFLIEY